MTDRYRVAGPEAGRGYETLLQDEDQSEQRNDSLSPSRPKAAKVRNRSVSAGIRLHHQPTKRVGGTRGRRQDRRLVLRGLAASHLRVRHRGLRDRAAG